MDSLETERPQSAKGYFEVNYIEEDDEKKEYVHLFPPLKSSQFVVTYKKDDVIWLGRFDDVAETIYQERYVVDRVITRLEMEKLSMSERTLSHKVDVFLKKRPLDGPFHNEDYTTVWLNFDGERVTPTE